MWKVQESQVSPLGCSPSVPDAALLAPPQLSCCAWNAQCSLLGVRAQHALGSSVPRCCMGVRMLARVRASSMLDMHQSGYIPSLQAFKLDGPPKMRSW